MSDYVMISRRVAHVLARGEDFTEEEEQRLEDLTKDPELNWVDIPQDLRDLIYDVEDEFGVHPAYAGEPEEVLRPESHAE